MASTQVVPTENTCPCCGQVLNDARDPWQVPVGRMLMLLGGLALVAAYFMPWFGSQGLLLSGSFLNDFLAQTRDLRQFLPGTSGNPAEAQQLRLLVLLFPACGVASALLGCVGWAWPRWGAWADGLAALAGILPLAGLVGGLALLPQGSTREVGLWTMGAGAIAVLVGVALPRVRALMA